MKKLESLVPPSYLFRFEFDAAYSDVDSIDDWMEMRKKCVIPCFQELSGTTRMADVRFARGNRALFFGIDFLAEGVETLRKADGVHQPLLMWNLFLDTRPSDGNRRGTRNCHWIRIELQRIGSKEINIEQCWMRSARENPNQIDVDEIARRWSPGTSNMSLGLRVPFEVLTGFSPEDFPVMTMFYELKIGFPHHQLLALENHCRFEEDPSIWSRVRLGSPTPSKRNRRS